MNTVKSHVEKVQHPFDIISDEDALKVYMPQNLTELRAKLRNTRGEQDEAIRMVIIRQAASNNGGKGSGGIEVFAPKDGRPLIIELQTGLPHLKVMSGRVLIWADSVWGNSVEVFNDSVVDVVVSAERKATIIAHQQSKVTVHKGCDSWGHQTAKDDAELIYAV